MNIDQWKVISTHNLKNCCIDSIKYTYLWDKIINYCLRNDFITSYSLDVFSSICRAMSQSAPLPIGTVIYRGLKNKNKKLSLFEKGFSSFTLDFSVAKYFAGKGGTILSHEIRDPNFFAIFFSSDYGTSKFDEEEVLVGPGTNYKILSKEKNIINIDIKFNKEKNLSFDSSIDFSFNEFIRKYDEGFHIFFYNKLEIVTIIFGRKAYRKNVDALKIYNLPKVKFMHCADLIYRENFSIVESNSWACIYSGFLFNEYKSIEVDFEFLIEYISIHKRKYNFENWDSLKELEKIYRKFYGTHLNF